MMRSELHTRIHDDSRTIGDQLRRLGLNQIESQMAVPYMWIAPGTSDPYSPVVISIVSGLQAGLAKLGVTTRGDGYIDPPTSAGLVSVSGPRWKTKAWTRLYGEMIEAVGAGRRPHQKGRCQMYEHAMGEIPRSGFNFTKAGTAYGIGPANDSLFKELQRQINRLASTGTFGKIGVDGKIGKNTVAAVTAAEGVARMSVVRAHTPEGIARDADTAAAAFAQAADQLGIPARVSAPSSPKHAGGGSGAVLVDKTTGKLTVAKSGFVDEMMSPMGLGISAAVVLGLWLLDKQSKPAKKKKKTKRRRRAPRRRITQTFY